MWEGVAAFDHQMQLVDEWEKRLILKQKLLNLCAKGWVFLAFEEEPEPEAICFFKGHERLGATFRQGETNRRILRELFAPFAPIFHQGNIRRTLPAHFALKVVRYCAFEGLT